MSLIYIVSLLIIGSYPQWNDVTELVPVNMDSVIIIEDFDDGLVHLESFPGEDADPDSFAVTSENTFEDSPFSLKLFGNTWKIEPVEPMILNTGDIWQMAAFSAKTSEIHGFGIRDSANVLFYALAGIEQLDTEEWVTVYQGAFEESVWNIYQLPVADDWMTYFGYIPELTDLIFVNDNDSMKPGIVYFDLILNISNAVPVRPSVEIGYDTGKVYRNAEGQKSVDVQFYSTITDPDSESHFYYWDFGDDSTSTEQNPSHTFLVQDDHVYTVLLEVVDDSGRWGYASCHVVVDPGPTSFPITMNFVGDVSLGRHMRNIIDSQGVEAIFEPTKLLLGDAADITVANLECPFTDASVPHPTKNIIFKARPKDMDGIVYAGIDIVSLGNNHILDYLYPGMQETQDLLDSYGILYSGAGEDSYEAYRPVFHSESGVTIAFLASSDRTGQYSNCYPPHLTCQPYLNAGYNKPGFAYMDPFYALQQIDDVRNEADLVVMEFHAGNEYRLYPSLKGGVSRARDQIYGDEDYDPKFVEPTRENRELRQLCIDSGADIVICHHPHVLQGIELYNGKLIAHSLGNFAFDQYRTETSPSIILNTAIDETGFYEFTISPIYLDHYIPVPAQGELGIHILDYMARRSKELDTYLYVDRPSLLGRVITDTMAMPTYSYSFDDYTAFNSDDGFWISPPVRLKRIGNISSVDAISPTQSWEFRLGRETLWFGNCEDEGADLWFLNSDYEAYENNDVYRGERCIRHEISSDDPPNVVTNLQWPNGPYDDNSEKYMLHGYVKSESAHEISIEARYLNYAFSGSQLGDIENIGTIISGDTPWTYYYGDISVPVDTGHGDNPPDSVVYIDIRCNSRRPDEGEAISWFDDVGIIEWTEWQSLSFPLPVNSPNDFYYIQLRSSMETQDAYFSYTETTYDLSPLPVLTIDPPSLETVLNLEASTTASVSIGNLGSASLEFTVSSQASWISCNALTGTVESGADSIITLSLDASSLGEGIYDSYLIVRSNDPDQSLLFLPVELEITSSPIVTVNLTASGSSLELTWSPVPDALQYHVYRSETPSGPWVPVSVVADTTFTDVNAVAFFDQAYYQVTTELPSQAGRPVESQAPTPQKQKH